MFVCDICVLSDTRSHPSGKVLILEQTNTKMAIGVFFPVFNIYPSFLY